MRELAVAGKLVTTNAFLGAWRVGYCHYRDKPSRRSSSLVQTRRFQLSFVLLFLFSLTALPGQGAERVEPWDGDSDQAVRLIGDTGQSLWQRLDTVNKLAATHDASLAPKIEKLLDRVMPDILSQIDGWNAAGYERVVDFRLIGALHELGDDSENHRIAPLVAAGEEGGTEPVEEADHAAAAILTIGRVDPIRDIVGLLGKPDDKARWNAVKVLDRLRLPLRPVAQDLGGVTAMQREVSFTASRLKPEMEGLVAASQSALTLSPGVTDIIARSDDDRGEVRRVARTLADIVRRDLPLLHFDYYRAGDHVVICSVQEAAARWERWWSLYGNRLRFARDKAGFVLAGKYDLPENSPTASVLQTDAQAKISYLGEQTKPIPTVIFGLEHREIGILQRLSREHPGALYPNDTMPYTKSFTVTAAEFARMLAAIRPIVSAIRHPVPDHLSLFVLTGEASKSEAQEFFIPGSVSKAFYHALLGALSPRNKPAKALLETQCRNVCSD